MSFKECVICGVSFGSQRSNARYCSDDCRQSAHKEIRKQWRKSNPNYMKDYMQSRRKGE